MLRSTHRPPAIRLSSPAGELHGLGAELDQQGAGALRTLHHRIAGTGQLGDQLRGERLLERAFAALAYHMQRVFFRHRRHQLAGTVAGDQLPVRRRLDVLLLLGREVGRLRRLRVMRAATEQRAACKQAHDDSSLHIIDPWIRDARDPAWPFGAMLQSPAPLGPFHAPHDPCPGDCDMTLGILDHLYG
ncbi:hypothetical protein JF55_00330 [Pseudomonas sp. 1-7]|nr:hypothetical protein JF55_00330 [Pseudomonas sp. 1-7]